MNEAIRWAAITGASSGLGETFARRLAARGANLLLIARRKQKLDELAGALAREHGVQVEVLAADLADESQLETAARRIAALEHLDLLVNNAGFGTLGRFFEIPVDGQMQMHRLHVLATVRLTHAVLSGMVARARGGIINVSSVAGYISSPDNVSYCATKDWMNRFTEGLRIELDSIGSPVAVQALCPGFTHTEFHETLGIDSAQIPKSLWMTAGFVVDESLRALESRKLFVVPGWRYRLFTAFVTKLPVGWRLAMERRAPHRQRRK